MLPFGGTIYKLWKVNGDSYSYGAAFAYKFKG